MNPKKIKEGGDVYFECIVDSNPNAYKVIWRHNVRSFSFFTYSPEQLPVNLLQILAVQF